MAITGQASSVEETKESARRWMGFVCPDCRFVFRVPRDHDGKGIVCPSCRRVLRIPGNGDVPPPLLAPIKKAGYLEIGEDSPRTKLQQKRIRRESSGRPMWERRQAGSPQREKRGMSHMLIGSGILFSLLVGGIIFALTSGNDPAPAPLVKPKQLAPPLAAAPATLIQRPQASLASECEPIARKFLEARSIEEILPLIHQAESAEPKLRRHYSGGVITPQGLSDFNVGQSMQILGKAVSFVIRNRDFDQKNMAFIDNGPDGMKLHWESFVGWSDMPWQQFMDEKPKTPKVFRVLVSEIEYYNFGFRDDGKWQSYALKSPDKLFTLYGYVEKDSLLNSKIKLNPDVKISPMMLSLKFPEDGLSPTQVIIESQVAEGWIEQINPP